MSAFPPICSQREVFIVSLSSFVSLITRVWVCAHSHTWYWVSQDTVVMQELGGWRSGACGSVPRAVSGVLSHCLPCPPLHVPWRPAFRLHHNLFSQFLSLDESEHFRIGTHCRRDRVQLTAFPSLVAASLKHMARKNHSAF